MAEWERPLLQAIHNHLKHSPHPIGTGQIHLAVLIEPYLSMIMAGQKTIESRFCRRKWTPYGMVRVGDTLILKRSSGPVIGLCKVAEVFYYDLSQIPLETVRERFGKAIAAPQTFWNYQKEAQFVSLFRIADVTPLPDIQCHKGKGDRRAWVVMRPYVDDDKRPSDFAADQAREIIRHQFAVSFNPSAKSTGN
jgi:ASC-1-like (ASCH) protein